MQWLARVRHNVHYWVKVSHSRSTYLTVLNDLNICYGINLAYSPILECVKFDTLGSVQFCYTYSVGAQYKGRAHASQD
jgi:hypothetical protein